MGKKGVDRGNKRRFFKNAFRFIKHPLGYVGWKSYRFLSTMPRILTIAFFVAWFGNWFEYKTTSMAAERMDDILQGQGKNVEGTQGRMKGYHHKKVVRAPNAFDYFMRAPLTSDQIEINPTWTQNIMKELQLTNAYNVEF